MSSNKPDNQSLLKEQ